MKPVDYDDHLAILIGDIYRNWRALIDAQAKAFDLTRTEWHILGKLDCRGPSLTQLDLGNYIGMDTAQLTRALNNLERKGYIRKSMDSNDKRIRHIVLIDPDAPYIHTMNKINNRINDAILKALSEREQKSLFKLLQRVRKVTSEITVYAEEETDAQNGL